MAYKFKFFAQPVITNIKTLLESAFVEFSIGVICAVFAFMSFGIFLHLFIACAIISIACFCLTIFNLYNYFSSH